MTTPTFVIKFINYISRNLHGPPRYQSFVPSGRRINMFRPQYPCFAPPGGGTCGDYPDIRLLYCSVAYALALSLHVCVLHPTVMFVVISAPQYPGSNSVKVPGEVSLRHIIMLYVFLPFIKPTRCRDKTLMHNGTKRESHF